MDCKAIVDRITQFIREIVEKSKSTGVVLGLSGGVDSAVVAFLCVKALGREKVLANIMPEKGV
ncbi:MAG: NAD(+) synthase, partial [Archaeoglobaceae archaeon]